MKKETETFKQALQIDMEAQAIFTDILKEGLTTKEQHKLYKDIKQLIKQYPKNRSTTCQALADTLADVYIEKGLLGAGLIDSEAFDKLIEERYTYMLDKLPKEAMKAFKETKSVILKLAYNNDLSVDQAINYYITQSTFKGLYVRDGANRRYRFKDMFKRLLRDTMKDSTRDACDQLADELGTDIFQISSHANPRPKCALVEKKLVSNKRGTYKDLKGKKHKVIAWSDTSVGQGDGLFGYNCRHIKYPMVPGVSRLPKDPLGEAEKAVLRYEAKLRNS